MLQCKIFSAEYANLCAVMEYVGCLMSLLTDNAGVAMITFSSWTTTCYRHNLIVGKNFPKCENIFNCTVPFKFLASATCPNIIFK